MGCYITTVSRLLRLLAHQHFVCVYVAALHQMSEEKMTETELALTERQHEYMKERKERLSRTFQLC